MEKEGGKDNEVIQKFKYAQVPMHYVYTNGKELLYSYNSEFFKFFKILIIKIIL